MTIKKRFYGQFLVQFGFFFLSLFLEKGNSLTVETICEVLSFTSLQHSKHSGNIWTDVKDRKTVQLFSSHGINRKLHAFNLQTKNVNPGAGDMTQQLNANTALAEDLNLVSSTQAELSPTICNSSFVDLMSALFWFLWTLYSDVYIYTQTHSYIHN